MLITINSPVDEDGVVVAHGTEFILEDGTKLEDIQKCVVTYERDNIVIATLDIAVSPKSIEANPMLSKESLRRAAEYYGWAIKGKEIL